MVTLLKYPLKRKQNKLDLGSSHLNSFHRDTWRSYCMLGTILGPANMQWTEQRSLFFKSSHPIGKRQRICIIIIEIRWRCVLWRKEKVDRELGEEVGLSVVFSALIKECLNEKVTFEQGFEGGESESHGCLMEERSWESKYKGLFPLNLKYYSHYIVLKVKYELG